MRNLEGQLAEFFAVLVGALDVSAGLGFEEFETQVGSDGLEIGLGGFGRGVGVGRGTGEGGEVADERGQVVVVGLGFETETAKALMRLRAVSLARRSALPSSGLCECRSEGWTQMCRARSRIFESAVPIICGLRCSAHRRSRYRTRCPIRRRNPSTVSRRLDTTS